MDENVDIEMANAVINRLASKVATLEAQNAMLEADRDRWARRAEAAEEATNVDAVAPGVPDPGP